VAFADFRGNKQYISTGNLLSDDRVALIFVDYPRQARLKILGRVKIFEGQEADSWLPRVRISGYEAVIERVYLIAIEAYDWNCPQHIMPRYTAEEIREGMQDVEKRMQALNEENEALRKEIAKKQCP
jgi:predicted pyridoxine 5'-phosphate oxidase superfamily flavin-nucleotide-binding protein